MKAKQRKLPNPRFRSRKQLRKEKRKEKKARRHEYYTNRNRGGKFVLNPDKAESKQIEIKHKLKSKSTNQEVTKTKSKPQVISAQDQQRKSLQKEKRVQEKLQKQMNKQRKQQLLNANDEEDKNIRMLEKQLRLNKRKSKNMPKSFSEDGLDYLLEICDPENMKTTVEAEQHLAENNDGFEEDLALMTGKPVKKQKVEDKSDDDADIDLENDSDSDNLSENDTSEQSSEEENSEDINSDSEGDDNQEELKEDDDEPKQNVENGSEEEDFENNEEEEEEESGENEGSGDENKPAGVWEDIYGRLRRKDGTIVTETKEKYIPPAIRAKIEGEDAKRGEKLNRLRRQIKGLLNRLAESNMHSITSQIEDLYMNNSRNDMNDTLTALIFGSLITSILTPERLLLEHVLLVTILHANVGTEVGAHFIQNIVKKFDELFNENLPAENKMLDNAVWIIAELYNYKVFHVKLVYEILTKLSRRFGETDIECILLILKNVGFSMRKDDPLALKDLILQLQKQANSASEIKENPRVKFMLDILLAIKNNNMTKIPNYDTSYSEHLKKLQKNFIRKGSYVTTLNISLEDLLKADEHGKWWVVGSAWSGKTETEAKINPQLAGFSKKLLDLARKQRMNTDARRSVFCIIMSAEDYLDAFEKLLHLGLKNQQEREIIHVILHCCLQEKSFNAYYAVLAQKFCEYDRRFQMIIKYSVWDKLKALTECSATQLSNLAKLLTHLFLEKGLPISTLKIVQFGDLDKTSLRFMRQILIGILLCEDIETCQGVFTNVGQSEKLKMFRESLRLFIQHFLLKNLKSEAVPEEQKNLLLERAEIVDKILRLGDKRVRLTVLPLLFVKKSKMKVFLLVLVILLGLQTAAMDMEPFCPCPKIWKPVCASNGVTYGNKCEFECIKQTKVGKHLRIVKNGKC